MNHTQERVGFIGGGRVARVLVGGWRHHGVIPAEILINEPDDSAFSRLAALCPEVRRSSLEHVAAAEVVFLALHPPVLASVVPALRPCLSAQAIIISLAPKIPLSTLTAGLGTARVARMIPNAPSIIGRGYNPVAFAGGLDATARQDLSALFTPWGTWPEVDERHLEAYAIVTGMGPTYFWYQWQALREAAGQFGLSPEGIGDPASERPVACRRHGPCSGAPLGGDRIRRHRGLPRHAAGALREDSAERLTVRPTDRLALNECRAGRAAS
jgi:pyrroline-5-carboxylate reductase